MEFLLRCGCGTNLKANVNMVGKELNCPKCAQKIVVPPPPVAQVGQPDVMELQPVDPNAFPQAPVQQMPGQPMAGAPGMPMQQAPVRKVKQPRTKKSRITSLIIMAAIIGVFFIIFIAVLLYAWNDQREKNQTSVPPEWRPPPGSQPGDRIPPPEPPPGRPNPMDSGNKNLYADAAEGSETNLDLQELITRVEPSIVRLKVFGMDGESVGSGSFIDNEGKIVTNAHVVEDAFVVDVSTHDGKKTRALGNLIVVEEKDLAIIQIDPKALDVHPIAFAKNLPRKGEPVAAFGAPQGFSFTATEGIVSGVRSGTEVSQVLHEMSPMNIYREMGYTTNMKWIQTTAAISGGNSGGPLVNMKGELIGINTWTHGGGQNLNFTVTAEDVEKMFKARDGKLYPYAEIPEGRRLPNNF